MAKRIASCGCGQLKVTCEGDPVRVSICHCLECQKRTGSIFGAQARFAIENVKVEGSFTTWVRTGDEGCKVSFRHCPTCGSTVCWEIDALAGFMAVAVGAFADPTFPQPNVAVYGSRRHAWAAMPHAGIEDLD